MLTVGDKIPEFKVQAAVSLEKGKEFQEISNKVWECSSKWEVHFF